MRGLHTRVIRTSVLSFMPIAFPMERDKDMSKPSASSISLNWSASCKA